MGKISEALGRFEEESRKLQAEGGAAAVELTPADVEALAGYDRRSKHLLRLDSQNETENAQKLERLRREGTIERLLANGLIHPGGKLTHRGLEEAERLKSHSRSDTRKGNGKAIGKPALPEISLETESPAKPAAADVSPPKATMSAGAAEPRAVYHPAAIDRTLVTYHQPRSNEAEQFKILRTNLLYPVSGSPPRTILVTSAAPGDGKSFAASNLAVSIAMNINRHVLLIDADLRKPDLHRRFGFGEVPGLGDYLARGVPLPRLLQKTAVEKLTLLPAGTPPENPSELVSSERMAGLLAEVAGRYQDRLIVVDAPPLAIAAESGVLARQVDGILVVIRHRRTRREELKNLLSRVQEEKLLGCFINGIEKRSMRYYGYYPYDYKNK